MEDGRKVEGEESKCTVRSAGEEEEHLEVVLESHEALFGRWRRGEMSFLLGRFDNRGARARRVLRFLNDVNDAARRV
jgi:hypothetical protein